MSIENGTKEQVEVAQKHQVGAVTNPDAKGAPTGPVQVEGPTKGTR